VLAGRFETVRCLLCGQPAVRQPGCGWASHSFRSIGAGEQSCDATRVLPRLRHFNVPVKFRRGEHRALIAAELSTLAIDFIFFHEVWHLILGHVDYLQKRNLKD